MSRFSFLSTGWSDGVWFKEMQSDVISYQFPFSLKTLEAQRFPYMRTWMQDAGIESTLPERWGKYLIELSQAC